MNLMPGGAGSKRAALALALLFIVVTPSLRAAADDDPFTATVTVDSTSDNATKARDMARADGARRALNAVVDRLAGGPGKSKALKLSDNQITDLVASFEVANEKMSAVRYVADYTFHFRPVETTKAIQTAGIAITGTNAAGAGGKPVVILPVYQTGDSVLLWDDPNPWRQAWSQRPGGTGTNLLLPLGDVSDLAAIDAEKARSGDPGALAAIAKKEGADEVLVMLAARQRADSDKSRLDVTVRRYRAGQFVDTHFDSIDTNPGEKDADLFRRAADAIATDIDNGWKNAKENLGDQQGSLVVVAPISGLDDWIKLRGRLATLPSVRKVDVKALSRQEATVEIQYVGSLDQLKANLAANKFDLQGGDPVWRLARSP